MACSLKTTDITLEASTVAFGKENVFCIEPVTGLVGGEYLTFSDQATKYYLWFSVNAVGVDPAPVGYTLAGEVALPTGYTVKNAVDLIASTLAVGKKFYTNKALDGLSILVETINIGEVLEVAADVDTTFTVTTLKTGISFDLGKTAEGIELTFEATTLDVTSNQTGTLVLDQIMQGVSASMSMGLIQVTKERLQQIIGEGFGDTFTPVAGTALVGFGTSKNFQSSFNYAGRLVLHPIRNAVDNLVDDVTFWKTLPLPESINYSGTDVKTLAVSFASLVDDTKPEEISVYAVGDSTQYLA